MNELLPLRLYDKNYKRIEFPFAAVCLVLALLQDRIPCDSFGDKVKDGVQI